MAQDGGDEGQEVDEGDSDEGEEDVEEHYIFQEYMIINANEKQHYLIQKFQYLKYKQISYGIQRRIFNPAKTPAIHKKLFVIFNKLKAFYLLFKYYSYRYFAMHQPDEYPVYNSSNYEGLNQGGVTIKISQQLRHSSSAENYELPQQFRNSRIKRIKCTCQPAVNQQRSCCKCGTLVCPGPLTTTSSRISDQIIKGESRIEYVPYQKKAVDYVDEERYILTEVKKIDTDYRQEVIVSYQPKEVTVTDYYAVEHIRCYVPETISQKFIQCVPIQRKTKKHEYIPVERQIMHYPVHSHDDEAPKYLGVKRREGPKVYDNISEEQYEFWEKQYGYKKGEPVEKLNEKIRQKNRRDKEDYFKRVSQSYQQVSRRNLRILGQTQDQRVTNEQINDEQKR